MKSSVNTDDRKEFNNAPDRYLFIIGAMKSGTTSLFDILSQHPQICSSKQKEPDYFIKDRNERAREEYLALWDWKDNHHSFALESSVAYSKMPFIKGVPARIYNSNLGQYRFIYMLRNPLNRIESQVRHGIFAGWGKSLDAGIPEDAISFSRYSMQLEKYLDFFPIESIQLVVLEEFEYDPNFVLSGICQFLGIDEMFEFKDVNSVRNSGEFFNTPKSISRASQSGFGQFIASRLLPGKVKDWLRNTITQAYKASDNQPQRGRWQLSTEEKYFVIDKLADDLKKLESEYGVNIKKYWHITADLLKKY